MQIIIDGRGKKMVQGGRRGMAMHVRRMRHFAGNACARSVIADAAAKYVRDADARGWTAGQEKHNRRVEA